MNTVAKHDQQLDNKRRHSRKASRFLVQLSGKDFQIYTNAVNICAGGAFINTLYLLNEGTFLNVKLQLPDSDRTLDLRGKVVRQVNDTHKVPAMDYIGMAIQFMDVNSEFENLLNSIVIPN